MMVQIVRISIHDTKKNYVLNCIFSPKFFVNYKVDNLKSQLN